MVTRTARKPPKIVLHVGEPKTGTTFLQRVLFHNADVLLEQGLLIPGVSPLHHWRATQDLREVVQRPNDPLGPFAGAWNVVVREALKAPRVGVVSHELLSSVTSEQAAKAVRSFGSAEVHIVVTVRDFGSLLPAEWQETIKHRNSREWEDWLTDVLDHEAAAPDRDEFWFWKVHDTLEVLRRWSALVPAERVHVITVPPRGSSPTLLWERFAALLGVDPTSVDLEVGRANVSLSLAEIELVRRINAQLPESLPGWFYMWHVKEALAHQAFADRPKTGGRLVLPDSRDEWVHKHAESVISDLRASGYDLVGDLDELVPRPPTGHRASPDDVVAPDVADAGVDAIIKLLRDLAVLVGIDPEVVSVESRDEIPPPPTGVVARVKAALIDYSRKHEWAHRLRHRYWRAVNANRRRRRRAEQSG